MMVVGQKKNKKKKKITNKNEMYNCEYLKVDVSKF